MSRRNSFESLRRSRDHCWRDFSRASFGNNGRKTGASSSQTRPREEQSEDLSKRLPPEIADSPFIPSRGRSSRGCSPSEEYLDDSDPLSSGSQILQRSDVFQTSPEIADRQNIQRPLAHRLESDESVGAHPLVENINVQPPTREPTRLSGDKDLIDTDLKDGLSQTHAHSLQKIVKAGGYPLQKAAGLAGFLRARSREMSNILASESMGYVEKVSGMWTGGGRFYTHEAGMFPEAQGDDIERDKDGLSYEDRFRVHFALPPTETLLATFFGHLHRVLPLYGKIYVSNKSFCFRSLLPGTRTKMLLPLQDIENVNKEKGFRFGYSGLVLVIRGHEELFFEFSHQEARDDCAVMLHERLESMRYRVEERRPTKDDKEEEESANAAKAEHRMLQEARQSRGNAHDPRIPQPPGVPNESTETPPILFDDPRASILNFKPTESLRIACLTIGSRGDVQPYISLCKRLLDEGHRPRIATHAEFEPWVRRHGIDFAPVEGDPAELMRICVENGMFTYSFLREASLKFRSWIDDLLRSAWKACQETDILIESPSAMAGIHIAEALEVPYFRAFTMPWTRTRAYPHAFAVPERKMGGAYNYMTYVMFDNVFWKAIAGQVNRWRKRDLGLRSTRLDRMQPNKVPFLYNFSPSVVAPPLDYSDWIRVTGYWFLDESSHWTPPHDLAHFITQARKDGKKLVYVGFGSIVVSDPKALTKTVVDSVIKADVRAILSKGWSDRLGGQDAAVSEVPLPPEILQIKSAPHDWLFAQIDAAAHHGGAGTTGASLRAGLPTIVKPFFGDQFFFGSRIEDLGVGICLKKLNVSLFSRALWEATHSERMIVKARALGEQIRKEDGVGVAVQAIYRDLEYAKSLIKHQKEVVKDGDGFDFGEESWTFIGDDSDPELRRRIAGWDPPVSLRANMHGKDSMEQLGSPKEAQRWGA